MNHARLILVTLIMSGLMSGFAVAEEPRLPENLPPVPYVPELIELGDGQYRIGDIEINRNELTMTVKGGMLDPGFENAPIEFIAVSKDAPKAYESLFWFAADPIEFNFACILLGLDHNNATHPSYHFDPKPVSGDEVVISVSWMDGETRREEKVESFLNGIDDAQPHAWVYTGSVFTPGGTYLASKSGSLIGVAHDMDSIIHHKFGLGLGAYGSVTANPDAVLPVDTEITLHVSVVQGK